MEDNSYFYTDEEFDDFLKKESEMLTNIDFLIASNPSKNYLDRIVSLSKIWKSMEEEIINHHKSGNLSHYRDYIFDYSSIFTPIEKYAWTAIRSIGNLPFYPQYPAGKFIIDFANPFFKIGIELDGKEYHCREKDEKRDLILLKDGWRIFRISGSDMYKTVPHNISEIHHDFDMNIIYENEFIDLVEEFYSCGDGLFYALRSILCKEGFHSEIDRMYALECVYRFLSCGDVDDLIGEKSNWN